MNLRVDLTAFDNHMKVKLLYYILNLTIFYYKQPIRARLRNEINKKTFHDISDFKKSIFDFDVFIITATFFVEECILNLKYIFFLLSYVFYPKERFDKEQVSDVGEIFSSYKSNSEVVIVKLIREIFCKCCTNWGGNMQISPFLNYNF